MEKNISFKCKRLENILKELESVVLAYSGGVDSSFLLAVCSRVLPGRVIAVTASSSSYPDRELKQATRFARQIKVRHIIIRTNELRDENYVQNPTNRCYYCKRELFTRLDEIRKKHRIQHIIDGSNIDDESDFRPGNVANKEFGVRSPLKEAGLIKNDIRVLSKRLNLSSWSNPSFACLSSRIPYNTKIDSKTLARIEKAEDFLISLGFRQVRVRNFGNLAKIEVDKHKIDRLVTKSQSHKVTSYLKKLGYKHITVDLEGYRVGSLNQSIGKNKVKVK